MRALLLLAAAFVGTLDGKDSCSAVFVRWPRVRLNLRAVAQGQISLRACQLACTLGEDPIHAEKTLECAALNHQEAADQFSHHCQVFQPHQLQNVDGFVEADDRYSFFWKYCLTTKRKCTGEYAFTYYSDRYMDPSGVTSFSLVASLEECLSLCLDHPSVACRSVSFNRTDGGCHVSPHSQLTRPHSIKINNNPNFRIDYYENNCYNMSETFTFASTCEDGGIRVKVSSRLPYTGALYGLYDFFTCRIEPKEQSNFEYFFPSPTASKNCSDSIRYKGDEMVLEVVLSTDGVEPLYFITPEDITFQAKCPIRSKNRHATASKVHAPPTTTTTTTTTPKPTTTTTKKPTTTTPRTTTTTTTTPKPTTTTTTTQKSTTPRPPPPSTTASSTTRSAPTTTEAAPPAHGPQKTREPITLDVFHNGLPVSAVVVGSPVTLSFTPHYAIPPDYMALRGCQVEPIGSAFDWEKEPLAVIKDGCPSDLVGIACPPTHTNFGLKVKMEAFRYQTTADIQYTCLVRVCPFAPCPVADCPSVEGCDESRRGRRALSLADIRAALEADPSLSRQIGLSSPSDIGDLHGQLLALAGDHVVRRRLVVVNSADELRYFVSTGTLPH